MKCTNHPDVDAVGACVYCGKLFCAACLVEVDGKNYCKPDIARVLQEAKETGARSSIDHLVVEHQTPKEKKNGLKIATKVLVIVFGVIGILWGVFAPMALGIGASMTGFPDATSNRFSTAGAAAKLVGSLVFIIAGMVLGLVSASTRTGKTATIVLGSLVIAMGIFSSILLQVVSGPVYIVAGILALVAGLREKKLQEP